jgi:hypothetical protein
VEQLGFVAYLWKSAAFEANVAQLAAPRRRKRTISQAFVEPCAVPGWRATSPIPPARVRVQAHMAMAEMMKTMSFAYTRPLICEGLARQLETAWSMYLWDWNNEETTG